MNEYYGNYGTSSIGNGLINYRPSATTGNNESLRDQYLRERISVDEIRQRRREIEHTARLTYEEFLKLADNLKLNTVNINANEKIINKVKDIKIKKNKINLVNL